MTKIQYLEDETFYLDDFAAHIDRFGNRIPSIGDVEYHQAEHYRCEKTLSDIIDAMTVTRGPNILENIMRCLILHYSHGKRGS